MPPIAPPPNPSLVAIILIVKSREGSRFVFHYPENLQSNPQQDRRRSRKQSFTDAFSSSSDSEDDSSSTSEDEFLFAQDSTSRKWVGDNDSVGSLPRKPRQRPDDEEETSSPDRDDDDTINARLFPWDRFFNLRTRALAGLLSPSSRSWHKRRFEVGLNDLCFLGWPVFVKEDGTWQKKRHRRKKGKPQHGNQDEGEDSQNAESDRPENETDVDAGPEEAPEIPPEKEKAANMTMFNVVFVLNPPVLEYSLRVREMYENIVKKFSKALKYEQSKSGFVWKEAKMILKLKDKGRENRTPVTSLYKEILEQSSLARAMASIYCNIAASKIAGPLMLTSETQATLQIPPLTSVSVLPSLTDPPALPGLWLTTATSVNDEHVSSSLHAGASTSLYLAKHFALLLLDNESAIIKDIMSSDGPIARQLVHYIRSSPPTKSFAKVSARAQISLNDIRQLADHLVYWRRARAIPPLHQRDTYIVSPNADMRRLDSACKAYEATFPTLPSLPKMLAALSGPPRPYGTLIPTKDHKEAYFQILAWLLRGGWVTQLRTFAWVRVDREVKVAVNKAMKEERRQERNQKQDSQTSSDGSSITSSFKSSEATSFSNSRDLRPSIASRSFSGSQASSIPHSSAAAGSSMPASSSVHSSSHQATDLSTSSLILNPIRASPLESAWLSHITTHLVGKQSYISSSSSSSTTTPHPSSSPSPEKQLHDQEYADIAELKHYFPIFAKEMDGTEALEKIPVKEGMKRLRAWELLSKMGVGDKRVSVDVDEEHGNHTPGGEKDDNGDDGDDEEGYNSGRRGNTGSGGRRVSTSNKGGEGNGVGVNTLQITGTPSATGSGSARKIVVSVRHW